MRWKRKQKVNWFILAIMKLEKIMKENSSICNEIIFQNFKRLHSIAFIAIPVSLFHIFIFWCNNSIITTNGMRWRTGIMISHVTILIYMGLLLVFCFFFKKKSFFFIKLLITITITIIFLSGIIITMIDQLVTSNITPFLIVCVINAAVFLMRPYFAAIAFSSAYGLYYYALQFTQLNDKILLSNRVNGLTAVGIGFGLSVILWKNKVIYTRQRRVLELQQFDLEESNLRLSELNKMKDKLFTIITHDVREPMSTMISLMELLEYDLDPLNNDAVKVIKSVKSQMNNTYYMLDGLLDWCKNQSKGLTINRCNWELYDIVYDMLDTFRSKINAKKLIVVNDVDQEICVFIDRDLFELGLRNIINNAIKFTKQEGTITISTEKKNKRIIISIQDNGIGISPSKLQNLFNQKEVKSSLGTEGEKGLGIGLHLSLDFIQRIDGQIWAESVVGKGSTFYISVPSEKIT
ncbi:MAG: integral rane sensor signal transduction histidine kinase [Anaerocolumna sp.]|jgi:signal transduction histidine kinase|nr:integral rane sensor signal transduction histidine kinase [Anaerocolumna sp.]